MRVATGRRVHDLYGERSREVLPDIEWAVFEPDGTWSAPPGTCDVVLLAGDAYHPEFIDAACDIPAPVWAHTEDAGTDGRFYDAMRERGAMVTHSPGANAPEVAEFAVSLILWTAKHLGSLRDQQRARIWRKRPLESLSDKTVLVVGLGAIGGHVARVCKALGMRVLGIRRSPEPVETVDRQGTPNDLGALLGEADFVVLALPHGPDTERLIDEDAIARMKPGATLVNVARGGIVDLEAVRAALASGHLGQACLDVLPVEPWPDGDPLWETPGLFLTPHNAAKSPLYLPRVGELWLENLRRYVAGEPLLHRAF